MTFQKNPDVAASSTHGTGTREASLALETGPAAMVEFWNRIANEAVQFAADRLCETVRTQQQMMQCHTLAEVAHLRARWWQQTVDQYAAEAGRYAEIWSDTLDRSLRVRLG